MSKNPRKQPRNRKTAKRTGQPSRDSAGVEKVRASHVSVDVLRTLLTFCDEAAGVSSTARRLGVSQPVVSRKLDGLTKVETCGAILLRRDEGGTLQLTEAGRASLPAIRELVRKYDQLLSFWNAGSTAATTVSLGVGQFAAQHYVPRALATLRQTLPDCEVTTHVVRGADRILGTHDGRFDLSIVSHDPSQITALLAKERGPRAKLVVEEIASLPLVVMAARDSSPGRELAAIAANHVVPLRKLATWELVGLDATSGIRRQLESRLRDLRIPSTLTFVAEGGGWSAAREFARHGLGVAILPVSSPAADDEDEFTVRRLSDDFCLTEFAIHRDELSDAGRQVQAAIRECARNALSDARA